MNYLPRLFAGFIVVFFLVVVFFSAFVVNEGECALVLRLGKLVVQDNQPDVLKPGLHFKLPVIDTVHIFNLRMHQLSTSPQQPLTVVTKEQTYLDVEYFAKWRIVNLAKFYTSTGGDLIRASDLLEQRLNDLVRSEFGKRTSDQAIAMDRAAMMSVIQTQAQDIGKDLGVRVVDVRIQQITLPEAVLDSVFTRMASERRQFAESKRAQGIEKSEEIRALADQQVTVIKAKASADGAALRAEGDQTAAQMYAAAYNANRNFYDFYRSLEAYRESFSSKNDLLVIKPDGQFFKYFRGTSSTSQK
ncbi:MAG: protease modulator HflC [Gammaproteobacteria bacterium]|nr:protease modulator HflC [Gammaproteobacteria bacterium]